MTQRPAAVLALSAATALILMGCAVPAAPEPEAPAEEVTPTPEALVFSGCPDGFIEALQAMEDELGGGDVALTNTILEESAADIARPALDPFLGDACMIGIWTLNWVNPNTGEAVPPYVQYRRVYIPGTADPIGEALEGAGYASDGLGSYTSPDGQSGFYLYEASNGAGVDSAYELDGFFTPYEEPFVVVDVQG